MIFYFSYKKLVFSWKKLPKMISRSLASFECTGGSPWLAVKHLWKPMKGFGDILWMFRKSESFLKVIERHRCYLLAFIHRPSMSFIQNITIILCIQGNLDIMFKTTYELQILMLLPIQYSSTIPPNKEVQRPIEISQQQGSEKSSKIFYHSHHPEIPESVL